MRVFLKFCVFIGIMGGGLICQGWACDKSAFGHYLDNYSSIIGLNGNVLIAHDEEVVFSKSYGFADFSTKEPLGIDSQFCIGSVTKQFTAVAILKLVQEGQLSLEDKIGDLIPEFSRTPWAQGVTTKHLLAHTSGIFEPNPRESEGKTAFIIVQDVVAYLADKPSISKPGSLFLYSNNGYLVLGYLLEKKSKKSLEDYFKDVFFAPLAMDSTYLHAFPLTPNYKMSALLAAPHVYKDGGIIEKLEKRYVNFPFSAGGIVSTTGDLWRWNKALYAGKIISTGLLEALSTPNLLGYGFGITVETFANGTIIYKHGGAIDGYHSLLAYLPKQKITITVLTNVDYYAPHRMEALMSILSMMIH